MNIVAYILIVVIVFAVVMYVVNNFFTIDPKLKGLVNLVLLIIFLLWLFGWSGLFYGHNLRVN